MDDPRKRKFNTDFKGSFKAPKRVTIPRIAANGKSWSSLTSTAETNRALALKHTVTVGNTTLDLTTVHTHGDFLTKPTATATDMGMDKHNLSTAEYGKKAKSFDTLLGEFGSAQLGATNTMRVLKGKHTQWKLSGDNVGQGRAATVLAAEIGMSEYARGGTYALANAMSGLYLMKHGAMTKSEFSDPDVGFIGSGEGGAKRLRTLAASGNPAKAFHMDKLLASYKTHASKKLGKDWSGKSEQEGFDIWLRHKAAKWTARD